MSRATTPPDIKLTDSEPKIEEWESKLADATEIESGTDEAETDEDTEQELIRLRAELAGIEKELTPELLNELDEWRNAVIKAIGKGDVEKAEQEIQTLRDAIPDARESVAKTKHISDTLAGLKIAEKDSFTSGLMDKEMLKRFGLDEIDGLPIHEQVDLIDQFRHTFGKAFETTCDKLPRLPGPTIEGCVIQCSKPVITLRNPAPAKIASGMRPPIGVGDFALSGTQLVGGMFGVYVAVTLTAASPTSDVTGWSACLLQNCNSNRSVSYGDGSSVSHKFGFMADIAPQEEKSLVAGKPISLSLTDAPKWQWCDKSDAKIDSVAVDDTFIVYLLVWKKPGDRRCVLKIEWSFRSDGKSANYAIRQLAEMKGADNGGAILTGAKANAQTENYQPGKAKK